MEKLTLPEQEVLEILKQLEDCCDYFKILQKKKVVKSGVEVEIMADDIKTADVSKKDFILVIVEEYLKEKGLDFSLTKEYKDYIKNDLTAEMYEGGDFNVIGIIKGESIQEIKEKISGLKKELSIPRSENALIEDSDIVFYYESGILKIGDVKIEFRPETLECQLLRSISDEPFKSLEWDEIGEAMEIIGSGKEKPEVTRIIGDARDRINEKIKRELHTSENLISRKNNRFKSNKKIMRQ